MEINKAEEFLNQISLNILTRNDIEVILRSLGYNPNNILTYGKHPYIDEITFIEKYFLMTFKTDISKALKGKNISYIVANLIIFRGSIFRFNTDIGIETLVNNFNKTFSDNLASFIFTNKAGKLLKNYSGRELESRMMNLFLDNLHFTTFMSIGERITTSNANT